MATFSKKGFRKVKSLNGLITEREMRLSKSSTALAMRGKKTAQLTENSVIFDNVIGSSVCVHLSLFFKDKAPINFNVRDWFDSYTDVMKIRISDLMLDIVFGERFQLLVKEMVDNNQSGSKLVRCITSDVVEGEREDIIGYLFLIEYNQ